MLCDIETYWVLNATWSCTREKLPHLSSSWQKNGAMHTHVTLLSERMEHWGGGSCPRSIGLNFFLEVVCSFPKKCLPHTVYFFHFWKKTKITFRDWAGRFALVTSTWCLFLHLWLIQIGHRYPHTKHSNTSSKCKVTYYLRSSAAINSWWLLHLQCTSQAIPNYLLDNFVHDFSKGCS